jgi:hypothetical protein
MLAKDAFDSVCALVFKKYENDGWKYSKSSHRMTKKDKRFLYRIYFYTSWRNISDSAVSFYGECAILPLQSKDKVFYLSNHSCGIPEGSIDWNIADKDSWEQAFTEFTGWLDEIFMPMVDRCTHDFDHFMDVVVQEGFYPKHGYIIDIAFVLNYGSRKLAEIALLRYYENMDINAKRMFKENYESMIIGGEAVSEYGTNMMRNYSNFKTIIENKIVVDLSLTVQ